MQTRVHHHRCKLCHHSFRQRNFAQAVEIVQAQQRVAAAGKALDRRVEDLLASIDGNGLMVQVVPVRTPGQRGEVAPRVTSPSAGAAVSIVASTVR